jgi:hypothetical protein
MQPVKETITAFSHIWQQSVFPQKEAIHDWCFPETENTVSAGDSP